MAPRVVFQGRQVELRPASLRSLVAQAERSYVMVKPDGVQRGLVGQIITRFEQKGFQIKGLKMFQTPEELAKEHYKDLAEKPFYGKLVDYILSGPVVCIVRPSPSAEN
jgi:nucleoside-diphosphate kinase